MRFRKTIRFVPVLAWLCAANGLAMAQEQPSAWSRADAQTLVFSGKINEKAASDFARALDDEIESVVVTSVGGEVDAALQIADVIHRRKLDVTVKDYCLSSCANYLFLAADRKVIAPHSVLGFHGSSLSANIEETVALISKQAKEAGQSDADVAGIVEFVRSDLTRLRQADESFADRMGFDRALLVDTGADRLPAAVRTSLGDGNPVFFPSQAVLERCYRVIGVEAGVRPDDSELPALAKRAAEDLDLIILGDSYLPGCASAPEARP